MLRVGDEQLDNISETSKLYWRNWLLVEATCCPQKSILVKVSRPLKSSHVFVAELVSLRGNQQVCGWKDPLIADNPEVNAL